MNTALLVLLWLICGEMVIFAFTVGVILLLTALKAWRGR